MDSSEQSDETDSEQDTGMTRREILVGGLIAAGSAHGGLAASATTNDDDLNVGGGKMADANLSARVKIYSGTLSERPAPGTTGRFWKIDDPGTTEHGTVYKDTGSTWEKIDLGVGSFTTEEVNNVYYAGNFDGADGGEKIQNAIDEANSEPGPNVVLVDGAGPDDVSGSTGSVSDSTRSQNAWELSTHVSIPSHTTILLRNAYVFLADGADDNLIRNSDFTNANECISIIGDGNSVFDGNFANQTNYGKNTSNSVLQLGLRFFIVDHLTLRGFKIRRTAAWGIKAEDVTHFSAKAIEVEQGTNTNYTNRDGVHVVGPAKYVQVDGVFGQSYDDAVAVGANEPDEFAYNDGPGGDVQNVSVSNVDVQVHHAHAVRIFEGDDKSGTLHSVENVTVSDISFLDGGSGGGAVILGDGNDVDDATKFTDITVENVTAQGRPALKVGSACRNVSASGLTAKNASDVIRFNHGVNPNIAVFKSQCGGFNVSGVHGTEVSHLISQVGAGGIEESTFKDITLKSDGATSLTSIIRIAGSSENVIGCTFSNITGFANDGGGANTGTLLTSPTGNIIVNSTVRDVNIRQVETLFDLKNIDGVRISNIFANNFATAYTNTGGIDEFMESVPNVPNDPVQLALSTDTSITADGSSFYKVPFDTTNFGDSTYLDGTNNGFKPIIGGRYRFVAQLRTKDSHADNTGLAFELRNLTANSRVAVFYQGSNFSTFDVRQAEITADLNAGDTYALRVQLDDSANDSAATVQSNNTFLTVNRAF